MKALCAKLNSGKGSSKRQSRKANKMWGDSSSIVRSGRWSEPQCIYIVLQSKWDNESVHIRQTRGANLASDKEGGPLAATVQNCLRNLRLRLAKAPTSSLGASWVLAVGAKNPLREAATAKLVGHTGKEWTAAGCPGSALALLHTTQLMSPKEAKSNYPNRADTRAYSWKSAPGKPKVGAARAKAQPRLVKRNRFGDGKEYRSGPNTRLQPPVLRSTRFVLFGRAAPHPPGGAAAIMTASCGPGDLPIKVVVGHPQWDAILAVAKAVWAAGAGSPRP
jgi:hypothetical protein